MKRAMLFPLVFLLILASTTTPALATKGKTEEIKYTLNGQIMQIAIPSPKYGLFSLTFSGKIVGKPDSIYNFSTVDSTPVYYENYWEEYTFNQTGWLIQIVRVTETYDGMSTSNTSVYAELWSGQQPTWQGKLVVIWRDGSASTFSIDLNPLNIIKSSGELENTVEATATTDRSTYLWDDTVKDYVFVGSTTETKSIFYSSTLKYSVLSITFSGKLQSKGRPAIEGTFSLMDYWSITDGMESHYISGSGTFYPYSLSFNMQL